MLWKWHSGWPCYRFFIVKIIDDVRWNTESRSKWYMLRFLLVKKNDWDIRLMMWIVITLKNSTTFIPPTFSSQRIYEIYLRWIKFIFDGGRNSSGLFSLTLHKSYWYRYAIKNVLSWRKTKHKILKENKIKSTYLYKHWFWSGRKTACG